jgi:hypothetical protein
LENTVVEVKTKKLSRNRRKHATRARTLFVNTRSSHDAASAFRSMFLASLPPATETKPVRPQTRADCVRGPRPCPWAGCRWHVYLDVTRKGNIKLNWPDKEPGDLTTSCVLDVAERGGVTLEEVGDIMNLTRERVRQIEVAMKPKLTQLQKVHDDV